MVSGQVSTPRLDLGNEDLIRSHIHAIWLQGARLNLGKTPAELVELSGEDPSLKLKQSIRTALLDENFRDQALERGTALLAAMGKHLKDAPWYHDAWLREVLAHLESSFNTAMERWRFLYKAARSQARTQDRIIRDHTISTIQREVAERLRREAEQQLNLLCDASTTAQSDFYTYRYLASEGFLPGYNFPRLPLSAFIPGRRGIKGEEEFLSRPRFLAISEFGPGALIYHEGSRYQVTRVMMPVGTDNEIETLGLKICDTCGYLHPLKDGYKPDVCERCTSKLETTLPGLFRMQNVRTQRRQRISCDEEERLRLGYEIKTGVRFAERFGHPISFKNQVTEDTDKFLDLEYGDAAVIWRINYGWSRRKEREDRGFWLDVEKRQWASNPDEEDDDLPDANTNAVLKKVIPYVEDRRNSLVIRPWGEYTPEFMASLEAALKRAIQVSFHLEDSELATETLPSRDNRREILFYEASEGGAGVLRQLVTDTSVWSRLADVALDLLHYHPESGEDLQHAPHAKERCESACYDCLKSYGNQSDHSLLDRRLLREFLLALRSCSLNNPDPTSKGKSLEFQPTSTVAKQFCGFLLKYQLRVPEIGTPLSDCDASPDFIFKDRDNPTVIYIDGNESPREPQQDSILENKGFTVLRFGSLESWMPGIQRYPSIFGKPLYPETEKPKISFDPTLFSPSLISLLDSLSKISGVSINPGSDFLSEGKIVGQTLASVEKDKKLLVLVSKSEPQDLLTALQVQGTKLS